LAALLFRLFREYGYKVVPYKTLNLTRVTYVKDGKEFGYAQALQAIAAGLEPDYRMNPFTPKPNNLAVSRSCLFRISSVKKPF